MPRIVCISDTHSCHEELGELPEGDILIHAGDFTNECRPAELVKFAAWFREQPHPLKLIVPGNHDFCFDPRWSDTNKRVQSIIILVGLPGDPHGVQYLNDRTLEINGLKVHGCPWTPQLGDAAGWAFQKPVDELRQKYDLIPPGLDILITHGPAYGVLDHSKFMSVPAGAPYLNEVIASQRPRLHVCGHIHEGYGIKEKDGIIRVNAAVIKGGGKCDPPIVVDL